MNDAIIIIIITALLSLPSLMIFSRFSSTSLDDESSSERSKSHLRACTATTKRREQKELWQKELRQKSVQVFIVL